MSDFFTWIAILSIVVKLIIQIKIQKSKMDIFELFLYWMKLTVLLFLPIKQDSGKRVLIKIANIMLIVFYIAFASVLILSIISSYAN